MQKHFIVPASGIGGYALSYDKCNNFNAFLIILRFALLVGQNGGLWVTVTTFLAIFRISLSRLLFLFISCTVWYSYFNLNLECRTFLT